jgi:tetratricopeptide (TPR) repeat protein
MLIQLYPPRSLCSGRSRSFPTLLPAVLTLVAVLLASPPVSAEEAVTPAAEGSPTAVPEINPEVSLEVTPETVDSASEVSIAEVLAESDPELEQIQAQIDAGEFEIPKLWLQQIITDIEADSHRFDPALVRPIMMLGDIQALEGNYVDALDTYGRAVHLERVSSGLVSPGQVEIVYREAEVYRTLGDFKTANEREEYAYSVLRRSHHPHDAALLPGLFHLGNWYESTHNVFAARALYQRAADIYIANDKAFSLEALPAWAGIARTYRLERFPPFYIDPTDSNAYATSTLTASSPYAMVSVNNFPAGERALQIIIQIQREHHAELEVIAEAILDLADWHLLFDKSRDAFPLYQVAWEMMSNIEGFPIDDYFGEPRLIYFPKPNDPKQTSSQKSQTARTGLVTVQFDITEQGSLRRLETMASEPKGMMDFRVRKSLRISRYRPAMDGGIPVPTEDYVYTHEFSYYPQPTVAGSAVDSGQ